MISFVTDSLLTFLLHGYAVGSLVLLLSFKLFPKKEKWILATLKISNIVVLVLCWSNYIYLIFIRPYQIFESSFTVSFIFLFVALIFPNVFWFQRWRESKKATMIASLLIFSLFYCELFTSFLLEDWYNNLSKHIPSFGQAWVALPFGWLFFVLYIGWKLHGREIRGEISKRYLIRREEDGTS